MSGRARDSKLPHSGRKRTYSKLVETPHHHPLPNLAAGLGHLCFGFIMLSALGSRPGMGEDKPTQGRVSWSNHQADPRLNLQRLRLYMLSQMLSLSTHSFS
ncbi:hypothetical protein OPQ81_001773 [Rhizoctonia solani]|nr:hypothetical protein OPQ81_001773 [Rhizoctonia solani]